MTVEEYNFTAGSLARARSKLDHARNHLDEVRNRVQWTERDRPSSDMVLASQRAIELALKGVFELEGVDYDERRDFLYPDNEEELLQKVRADFGVHVRGQIGRVIVLHEIWKGSYPSSQHGLGEMKPEDLFRGSDGTVAFDHADEAEGIVTLLLDNAASRLDTE